MLTTDQIAILTAALPLDGWELARLICAPEAYTSSIRAGGTIPAGPYSHGHYYEITSTGIEILRLGAAADTERIVATLPWHHVRRHISELPPAAIDAVRAASEDVAAHEKTPPHEWTQAWHKEHARLRQTQADAVADCFTPLAITGRQSEIFDYLT